MKPPYETRISEFLAHLAKKLDKLFNIIEKIFCHGAKHGNKHLLRTSIAYTGVISPYVLLNLSETLRNYFGTKFPLVFRIIPDSIYAGLSLGFFAFFLPFMLSWVMTDRDNLSYCRAFFGYGLRLGVYSFVILSVLLRIAL